MVDKSVQTTHDQAVQTEVSIACGSEPEPDEQDHHVQMAILESLWHADEAAASVPAESSSSSHTDTPEDAIDAAYRAAVTANLAMSEAESWDLYNSRRVRQRRR